MDCNLINSCHTNRKLLTSLSGVLFLLGLGVLLTVFSSYFGVSEKANANRPHIPISDLSIDEYKLIKMPSYQGYGETLLLSRKSKAEVRAWRIPTLRDKYVMPDTMWGRFGYLCDGFGFSGGIFQCLDTPGLEDYSWGLNEFRWDKNGINLGNMAQDMVSVEGETSANFFIIGDSR